MLSEETRVHTIELLVVIAIIAILAAILFPVFARAREKARQTSCVSNMKQMATATLMYQTDYDGRFPNGYDGNGDGIPDIANVTTPADSRTPVNPLRYPYWTNAIQPYVKNWGLYACPSTWENRLFSAATPEVWLSYMFNGVLFNVQDSQIVAPPVCIMWWEGIGDMAVNNAIFTSPHRTGGAHPYQYGSTTAAIYVWSGQTHKAGFHSGGDNKAYCDGHVKWTKEPGRWDQSVWAALGPNGEFQSYWYDGYCPWLFRPVVQ